MTVVGATKPPKLFTVGEIAAAWSLSTKTIYRLVWSGELPHVRVGKSVRISEDTARSFIARRRGDRS